MYDTIDKTMEILHIQKGHILNTLKRFHIYNLTLHKQRMNDTYRHQ
jgi:hypothetical protein